MIKIRIPLEQRFMSKIELPHNLNNCWLWTGAQSYGYGKFWYNEKIDSAHRVMFAMYYGNIPDGKVIRHMCNNSICVNLDHLLSGTQKENMADRERSGHTNNGENVHLSKLTEKQVLEIREKYIPWKYSAYRLAKEYNVSRNSIRCIIHRTTWKHI